MKYTDILDSAGETAREQKNRAVEAGSEAMKRTGDALSTFFFRLL